MLSILTGRDEVAQAQQALENLMRTEFTHIERRDITFPGGGRLNDQKVRTSGSYWYHAGVVKGRDEPSPRFLNLFGVLASGRLRISVEVNVLCRATQGQSQGFFARDNTTGAVYLMHSGDIRGGARGVSGPAFRAWYGEPRRKVFGGDGRIRFGFIVIPLRALDPTRSVRRYVDSIGKFRDDVATKKVDVKSGEFQRRIQKFNDYYKEPRGRRTANHPGKIDYLSRHGEVVDALKDWREARRMDRNSRIVKDVFIDMGVEDARGNLVELYEVKTSTARTDMYSAIGQLIVHGPPGCKKKFVVVPKGGRISPDLKTALENQRIKTLRFRLQKNGAKIL